MDGVPPFADFYEALHGRAPFPWQERLAAEVLERGWPDLLDLPTGSGKTSAIEIALYTLACSPESLPRRVVLVVDRRIVVDQAADHARRVREAMMAGTGPAAAIASRLRSLWGAPADTPAFAVTVMRGGMPRDNDWARRPDQPVVGLSTVDQVGSRLLFRGYGLSDRSRPLHAGLLGNDTLILLDEVHLAVAFGETLRAVRKHYRRRDADLPDRFRLVEMSATPGQSCRPPERRVFALGAADRESPALAARLAARKRARLCAVAVRGRDAAQKQRDFAARAVAEALALQRDDRPVVAIVVNRVDTARMAGQLLESHGGTTDAILVTGRMRPLDRDALVDAVLLPRAGAGRDRSRTATRLVVVATQSIEAGADLDFDALVTECASLDALKQRFGRLDRRGALGASDAVILGRTDQIQAGVTDPVYGEALSKTWEWLQKHADDGVVDFGVDHLPSPPADEAEGLMTPGASAPVLLASHLEAWVQTSPRPAWDPDVALWLHGQDDESADVSVVWRADIGESADRDTCRARLAAIRPSSLEAISIPIAAARAWLRGERPSMADMAYDPGAENGRTGEGVAQRVFRWSGDDSDWIDPDEIAPGDVLVVPASRGGIRNGNFDPGATDPVRDLAELAALRGRGQVSLRLDPAILRPWGLDDPVLESVPMPGAEPVRAAEVRAQIREWAATWPDAVPSGFMGSDEEWATLRDTLRTLRRTPQSVDGRYVVVQPAVRAREATTELIGDEVTADDDSAFRAAEVTLRDHARAVREYVDRFSAALGLPDAIRRDLSLAAWLHDIGKADPRFQRWLVGGSEVKLALLSAPLAKSSLPPGRDEERELARIRAGYPARCRHELLSVAMAAGGGACATATDPDLVLHLVASHHGWCRPFPPFFEDEADGEAILEWNGEVLRAPMRHGLARLDSGMADRFWRLVERYGFWGLAWLESILRLADHRASEEVA